MPSAGPLSTSAHAHARFRCPSDLSPPIRALRAPIRALRAPISVSAPVREYTPEEVTAQDALPVDAAAKKAFFQGIAEQVFGL